MRKYFPPLPDGQKYNFSELNEKLQWEVQWAIEESMLSVDRTLLLPVVIDIFGEPVPLHDNTYTHFACLHNDIAFIEWLHERGYELDCLNKVSGLCEDTPLTISITYNRLEIIKYLLEKGADPLARQDDGKTALQFAYDEFNYEMTEFFATPEAILYPVSDETMDSFDWMDKESPMNMLDLAIAENRLKYIDLFKSVLKSNEV